MYLKQDKNNTLTQVKICALDVHTCPRIHRAPQTVQPRSSQGQGNCCTHTEFHYVYTTVMHSLPAAQ